MAVETRQGPFTLPAVAAARSERQADEPAVMRSSGSSITSGNVSSTPAPSNACVNRQS